jgi:DNA-binding response OmpR family regulator
MPQKNQQFQISKETKKLEQTCDMMRRRKNSAFIIAIILFTRVGESMKIGLLEDNPAILDYMSAALTIAGHEVDLYTYSDSFLQMLHAAAHAHSPLPYDLVVIDILLPGELSGVDIIAQIREWILPKELPIIVVSACSREELDEIKERFSQVTTLRKPFKTSMLLQAIEQIKSTL